MRKLYLNLFIGRSSLFGKKISDGTGSISVGTLTVLHIRRERISMTAVNVV